MKLTPEKLEELKETAEEGKTFLTFDPQAVLDLIADLEEARGMVVTLAPDALREAEERKNIAAGLEVVWQGRMRDAETAHQAELAAVKPAEKRCEYCDGTGDVHRGDGQWLGFCTCPAGEGGDRG